MREKMIHLCLPWLLEGAIRGKINCMLKLHYCCYNKSEPVSTYALGNYWLKRAQSSESKVNIFTTEILRKDLKKEVGNACFRCSKTDPDEDVTLKQCGKCEYFSYCGKECQLIHWKAGAGNHIGECKQLQILNEYHKPYARQIRKAIIRGDDPKNILELQTLREKLGLSRPKQEYEELFLLLGDSDDDNNNNNNNNDDDDRPNPYEYIGPKKDGQYKYIYLINARSDLDNEKTNEGETKFLFPRVESEIPYERCGKF